jgi:hypothetical protein
MNIHFRCPILKQLFVLQHHINVSAAQKGNTKLVLCMVTRVTGHGIAALINDLITY